MRWIRTLPTAKAPGQHQHHLDALRRLADHASERGLTLLIENYGWMQGDPDSVANLIGEIDRDVPACPDTGNWTTNEVRYAGLAKTFPLAATCDFKAKALGPDGSHAEYDLEKCFRIGWDAGFRGPWCIEHGHADRETQFRGLRHVRDLLRGWIKASSAA